MENTTQKCIATDNTDSESRVVIILVKLVNAALFLDGKMLCYANVDEGDSDETLYQVANNLSSLFNCSISTMVLPDFPIDWVGEWEELLNIAKNHVE